MTEPDWLAIPEQDKEPEKTFAAPVVSERALAVARERTEERAKFLQAWATLTTRQQVYLRALQQTGFSSSRALAVLNEAIRLDPRIGGSRHKHMRLNRGSVSRWARENPHYKTVLATLKAEAAVQVTSRDDLLLRAHRAAEYAEAEQPILHQGQDTGFRERNIGEMLKANEQLMKATKVLGSDDNRVQVAVGPALVVQVVQGDGSIKDVTPRGVVVDLPRPA